MSSQRVASLLVAMAGLASGAGAETCTWSGTTNGSWLDSQRWWPHLPGGNDDALVPSDGPDQILYSGTEVVHSLELLGAATSVNIVGGSNLTIQNSVTPMHTLLVCMGAVSVNANGQFVPTNLYLNNLTGSGFISGTGKIVLNAPTNANLEHAAVRAPSHIVSSLNIVGTGLIAWAQGANSGSIRADRAGRILQITSASFSNSGTMSAAQGILNISDCSLTQSTNGRIEARQGGTVNLSRYSLSGGKLRVGEGGIINFVAMDIQGVGLEAPDTGGFVFKSGESKLAGAGLDGAISLENGAKLFMAGISPPGDSITTIHGGNADTILTFSDPGTPTRNSTTVLDASVGNDDRAIFEMIGNVNELVRGNGEMRGDWTNRAVIQADVAGRRLSLRSGAPTNNNILRSKSGGMLDIRVPLIQNGAGRLIADGGTTTLYAALTGGTVETINGGTFNVFESDWTNVAVLGDVTITKHLAVLSQGLSNAARMTVPSGSNVLFLGGTITGAGTIYLNKTTAQIPYLNSPAIATTIGQTHTLLGTGDLGGKWINQGLIKPGNLFGTIRAVGDLTLAPASRLEIEVGDVNVHDVLSGESGVLTLGGNAFLKVSLWNFAVKTTSIDFVTSPGLVGKFATYSVSPGFSPPAGRAWRLYYQPTKVSLRATCSADLDGDFLVEDTDFTYFVGAYNVLDCADPAMPQYCPSDLNKDGVVDDLDFQIFVIAYNQLLCFS